MDICVPIISDNPPGEEPPLSPSAFFASTLMEVDFLRDTNKYVNFSYFQFHRR